MNLTGVPRAAAGGAVGRKLEQVRATHDIDLERELGGALAARREQRSEMPDLGDIVLLADLVDRRGVAHIAGVGLGRVGGAVLGELADIHGHDLAGAVVAAGEGLEECVAHLATRAGNKDGARGRGGGSARLRLGHRGVNRGHGGGKVGAERRPQV
jgi:hypothetical protein